MPVLESITNWLNLIKGLLISFTDVLTKCPSCPKWVAELLGEHPMVWWGVLIVLLAVVLIGLGRFLLRVLLPRSRLLQPNRFLVTAEDSRHLVGREGEIEALSNLCERHALVFLEGESGAGKSALVRAGLLKECARRGELQPVLIDL